MYNEDKQQLILKFLLSNEEVYVRAQNILSADYFDQSLKPVVRYVKEYADSYRALPSFEHIKAETGIKLDRLSDDIVRKEQHINAFLDMYESFCRHRALENAIYKAPDYLNEGKYGDVEIAVKNALMISLQKNMGANYWEDPKGRLERIRTKDAKITTGWKVIDDLLYGGFDKGALNIFAGSSGMGKSLFLQNITRTWARLGLNVIYISLELPEDLIALRLYAMDAGMSTKDLFRRMDDVEIKVGVAAKKAGAIQIKQMPQGSTINDIRAYLKEYTIQTGITPDAIAIDYLDLLHPNAKGIDIGNAFTKDKFVSEEMRGMATEMGLYLATASQLGREATKAATESGGKPEYDHSHIAGGISKINTADVVLTMFRDKKMEDEGLYRVQFIKTRSSNGVGRKVFLGFAHDTLIISDVDQPEYDDEEPIHMPNTKGKSGGGNVDIMSKIKETRAIADKYKQRAAEAASQTPTDREQSMAEKSRILNTLRRITN
jgi:archaellum biogenesis ATPase FlaH